MVTLKQGYKAYQISQEFIEDFKEKSKEKSTTDPARRRSGSSPQEADSKEIAQKEKSVSPGESSESGGESEGGNGNDRRLSKDGGDQSGGDDASLSERPSLELHKMDTEL